MNTTFKPQLLRRTLALLAAPLVLLGAPVAVWATNTTTPEISLGKFQADYDAARPLLMGVILVWAVYHLFRYLKYAFEQVGTVHEGAGVVAHPHGVNHIFARVTEWLLLVIISYVTIYYIFDILNFIIRIGSENLQGI
jgi:hypothetical protein